MTGRRRPPQPEFLRSLWFMPVVFVILSLVVGYLLSQVDVSDDAFLATLLFRGSVTSARQLLVVVSSTMITVTGLVFVLTVIALQIASTQFSPRLLRFFLRDFGTRMVLSTFVATFSYSLVGLFTVGEQTNDGEVFLPQLAVTGALLLALVSVGMLVFYIQHITNSIRIDTVMLGVEKATLAAIARLHATAIGGDAEDPEIPIPPPDAFVVPLENSGYVQALDMDALTEVAVAQRIAIRVRSEIGHHLVDGSGVAWAWAIEGQVADARPITVGINEAILVTNERLADRDIGFGLRQMVDVAIKAIAPSVNDPYTAVQAVQHLSVMLTALARVRTDCRRWRDESGLLRVFAPVVTFDQHLETVCSHIRRAAANRPRVVVELLRLLETVAASGTSPALRTSVCDQIRLIVLDAEREILQPADLAPVQSMARAAMHAAEHGEVAPIDD